MEYLVCRQPGRQWFVRDSVSVTPLSPTTITHTIMAFRPESSPAVAVPERGVFRKYWPILLVRAVPPSTRRWRRLEANKFASTNRNRTRDLPVNRRLCSPRPSRRLPVGLAQLPDSPRRGPKHSSPIRDLVREFSYSIADGHDRRWVSVSHGQFRLLFFLGNLSHQLR
jgi:hypothetical protein